MLQLSRSITLSMALHASDHARPALSDPLIRLVAAEAVHGTDPVRERPRGLVTCFVVNAGKVSCGPAEARSSEHSRSLVA